MRCKKTIDYHFHPSQIDTEHFPFAQWRKHAKNTIDLENQELLLHGRQARNIFFAAEIAHYLYHASGVTCSPEQIIVGAGIEITTCSSIVLYWRGIRFMVWKTQDIIYFKELYKLS